MISKAQLISIIDNLPENLTVDQIIEHIIFVEKVQNRLDDSENGKLNTMD